MININICQDFSETPGARYRSEGNFSGEAFRDDVLEPLYKKAVKNMEKITVNLDGGYGYPTSFLEEAFGGLARKYNPTEVLSLLEFISEDEPSLIEEIKGYIKNARKGE